MEENAPHNGCFSHPFCGVYLYPCIQCHMEPVTIVLTGIRMKPPKDIKYILVQFNSFIKSPRQMKGCLVMIYIQEHIS